MEGDAAHMPHPEFFYTFWSMGQVGSTVLSVWAIADSSWAN